LSNKIRNILKADWQTSDTQRARHTLLEMQLHDILFTQGFGPRRVCLGLVQGGFVTVNGVLVRDPHEDFDPQGLAFTVEGKPWTYQERAYLMLHKPAGYECSQKPGAWPSIYTLLPSPLRQRPVKGGQPGVQAIGRLDQDTTGLLLLSDDGAWIHKMSSPKHHVPKVYQLTTADPVDDRQVQKLLAGVVLLDDPGPVRAAACTPTGPNTLDLTLTEGKYHQVKRMLAAVGNRVTALHRSRIGRLDLPPGLAPGQWTWLTPEQIAAAMDSGQ
jgi:16S rRNA pseudouridine516 synthase